MTYITYIHNIHTYIHNIHFFIFFYSILFLKRSSYRSSAKPPVFQTPPDMSKSLLCTIIGSIMFLYINRAAFSVMNGLIFRSCRILAETLLIIFLTCISKESCSSNVTPKYVYLDVLSRLLEFIFSGCMCFSAALFLLVKTIYFVLSVFIVRLFSLHQRLRLSRSFCNLSLAVFRFLLEV